MSISTDVAKLGPEAGYGFSRAQRTKWRQSVGGYLLFLPAFVLVVGMLLYPVAYALALSLTDASGFASWGSFIGLGNYARLLADATFWRAAANTTLLMVVGTLLEVALGFGAALLMWRQSWLRPLLFVVGLLPWAMPSSMANWAWFWMLLPPFPTFYTLQAAKVLLTVDSLFGHQTWQIFAFMISGVWRGSAIIALILLAGLYAMPHELFDQGRLEAPNAPRLFWHVILPLTRRFVVLAILVGITVTYMNLSSAQIQRSGRITVPLVGSLAHNAWLQSGQTGYAAALGMIQLPVAIALMVAGFSLLEHREKRAAARGGVAAAGGPEMPLVPLGGRWERGLGDSARGAQARQAPPGRRHPVLVNVGLSAVCLVLSVFYLLPLYYGFVNSVEELEAGLAAQNPFWVHKFDFQDGWGDDLGDVLVWDSAAHTLIVYGCAVIIGTAVSLAAGYALARLQIPGAHWLARLMFSTYFIPQIVVVLPIFLAYRKLGLYDTLAGLVLIDLTLAIPFATWLFYIYFLALNPELEDSALLDTGRLRAFLSVVLPRSLPVIAAAVMFAVGMITSDVVYNGLLAVSNDVKTLPVYLGTIGFDPDFWADANADVCLSTIPFAIAFLMLGVYYVDGLRQAFGGEA